MKTSADFSLSAKARKFVAARVASGRYRSAKAVVEDALTLLERAERERETQLAAIDAAIDRGLADLNAGRHSPFDAAAVERIKRAGRERIVQRRKRSA